MSQIESLDPSKRTASLDGVPSHTTPHRNGESVFVAYVTVTVLGAIFNGAAVTYSSATNTPRPRRT